MAIRHLRQQETAETPRPQVAHTYRLVDIARYYGVDVQTLRNAVDAHELVVLPTNTDENDYLIHEDDLGRYLADRTVNALTGKLTSN